MVGLVLSGLVLCACGQTRSEVVPRPLSGGKSGTSPTTSPESSAATSTATSDFSLGEVFREEGVLLTGSTPTVAETLDFVAYFQYIDEACDQAEHSATCPVMSDVDVIAQMYLEAHNQTAIDAHQSASAG